MVNEKSLAKRIGIGCGVMVLLSALGMGACLFFIKEATDPPAEQSHAFFARLREGNVPAAWTMFSPRLQALVPLEGFQSAVASMPPLTTQTDATFTSRSVHNQTAEMSGFLSTPSGEVNVALTLISFSGSWVIDSLSVRGQQLQ